MLFWLFPLFLMAGKLPDNCKPGLVQKHFKNEFFADADEEEIIQSVVLDPAKQLYNSYEASGSFCPNMTGIYQLRIAGRAYPLLSFVDKDIQPKFYPSSLGPGGNCWPWTKTNETTEKVFLYNTRCYPVNIKLRTGCNLYDRYLYLDYAYENDKFGVLSSFVTCEWNDCYEGLYGDQCQNQCVVDCNGHGHCDDGLYGTGKCICDDGYVEPDCQRAPPPIPVGCQRQAIKTVYEDENNFLNVFDTNIITNLTNIDVNYTHKSVIIKGTILCPETGEYQFKISYLPEAQLIFNNKWYPNSRTATLNYKGVINSVESNIETLTKDEKYPFIIKYKSGTEEVDQFLSFIWKNGPKYHNNITKAPWEPIPELYFYSCEYEECEADKWGFNCTGKCDSCPEHSSCMSGKFGNGECVCERGYSGPNCILSCTRDNHCQNNGRCHNGKCICDEGFYGDHCEIECNPEKCSNHGICDSNGKCICNRRYYGDSCNKRMGTKQASACTQGVMFTRYDDELVFERIIDGPKLVDSPSIVFDSLTYDSVRITGSILVDITKKYRFRLYAQPVAQFTILNYSIPSGLGYGAKCDGSFTNVTSNEILLHSNTYYPFMISYRTGCPGYPQFINLSWNIDGDNFTIISEQSYNACNSLKCKDLYSGNNCSDFCSLTCNNHGTCQFSDDGKQSCKCNDDYYGENCESFCRSNVTCKGIGVCGGNGRCICPAGYSGPSCEDTDINQQLMGNSLSCTKMLSYTWYSDELFGPIESTETTTSGIINIDSSTSYKSLYISGSFSPIKTGYYRFKAVGKPTIQFSMFQLKTNNPDFLIGRCDDDQEEAETQAILINSSQLVPFAIQYRSGCPLYSKFVKFYYQLADQSGSFANSTWKLVELEQMRDCNAYQCEKGYYGIDCSNLCIDCGEHGECIDGVTGSGKCKCDEWHIGGLCTFDYFPFATIMVGIVFLIALIWMFWPTKVKEQPVSAEASPNGFISSEPMIQTASVFHSNFTE